jgi:hypothetical protein
MKKMQEKAKYTTIQGKASTPPQTKAKHKLPLKPSHVDGKHKVPTQEGSKKSTRFLNAKDHTPPEAKANHKLPLKLRQINPSIKFNQRRQLPLK